ncbi:sensor histidine kinase [Promicromonospora sukumoe]|uniref:sensor histidine kinase n=1 Tax=Promicromonospora sukumoe TaxID=88382 RepID=UPI00037818D0|nr:histidine kinase [Promicromonospora sukumoe]
MSAIRSVWDEPRPAGPPARAWWDWALVGVFVGAAVIEGIARPDVPGRWLQVATVVVLAPTLLWRRAYPLLMVAIAFVASGVPAVVLGRELDLAAAVFQLVLAYALFRWGSGRAMVLGGVLILAKLGINTALGFLGWSDVAAGLLILSAAFALGLAFRYRAGARRREREQVVLLERERLARDLHDVVGHHVSAVAVRAQAGLAVSRTDPAAAAEALRVIEGEATRALAEMRTLVRALRSDEAPAAGAAGDATTGAPADRASFGRASAERTPGPTLADVEHLADAGPPPVRVVVEGDPDRVSAAVGSAVHRIAQESVTNARRHARGATGITVLVTVRDQDVRLHVSDDGATPARPPREGYEPAGYGLAGYGLAGMRERAALLGGTLAAGPDDAGGWAVEAVLPLSGAARAAAPRAKQHRPGRPA